MGIPSTLALMLYVSGLAPLVHNEHVDGHDKRLALNMRRLKDEIQARGLNIVISSAHHGPVAANTGDEEWHDKTLLQQSREDRIHRVLQCLAPVSHPMVLPLILCQTATRPGAVLGTQEVSFTLCDEDYLILRPSWER